MKVSYLKKVLYTGLGTAFSEGDQSELGNKPSSTLVQLQQPIQNRFPFFTALWDYQNELEDVGEGIILDESFEDTSPNEKSGTMGNQESETNQRIESSGHGLKPKTNYNGEILTETLFMQDSPFSVRKKEDVDLHCTTELKRGRTDLKRRDKEVKKDEGGLQEIEDKVDIQKPKVKRAQPNERERIPKVEVVKQESIQVPRSNQLSFPSSSSQFLGANLPSQKSRKDKQLKQLKESTFQKRKSHKQPQLYPQKPRKDKPEKVKEQIHSDVAEQKKAHESETLVKVNEVVQKLTDKQELSNHFFTESLKKGKAKMARNNQKREFSEKVQPKTQKSRRVEIEKEKQYIPLEIEEHEKRQDSDTTEKANQVVQESSDQQDLKARYFKESLKENNTQMTKHTKQKGKLPHQGQPQPRKIRIIKPEQEKIRISSDITKQEKIHESKTLLKPIEVVQRPRRQRNLHAHFFTESLKKSENQMAKIAKDVALVTKKLNEHVSNEQSKPLKPVFLPRRPASHNLGGWSDLERNYIR